tara:strand:- start:324 stop:536 length:213 start_codon:yes stop_codon:yes gene_type:complete
VACHFLFLDGDDLADTMGGIHNRFAGFETLALRRLLLLSRHTWSKLPVIGIGDMPVDRLASSAQLMTACC